MAKSKYHVTQREDGSWQGKKEGSDRASTVSDTKQGAIDKTVEIAKNTGDAQVFIHGQDGKIQSERTYGDDPFPPKG